MEFVRSRADCTVLTADLEDDSLENLMTVRGKTYLSPSAWVSYLENGLKMLAQVERVLSDC